MKYEKRARDFFSKSLLSFVLVCVPARDMTIDIIEYLRYKYRKKGANFTFRAKQISKRLDITSQMVATLLKREIANGEPVDVIRRARNAECLYRTKFKGEN